MTYLCGIGPGFGASARDPQIVCDGCGVRVFIHYPPPTWFLDRKPKPGWTLRREELPDGSVKRDDRCPKCRVPPKRKRARAKLDQPTSHCGDLVVRNESALNDATNVAQGLGPNLESAKKETCGE